MIIIKDTFTVTRFKDILNFIEDLCKQGYYYEKDQINYDKSTVSVDIKLIKSSVFVDGDLVIVRYDINPYKGRIFKDPKTNEISVIWWDESQWYSFPLGGILSGEFKNYFENELTLEVYTDERFNQLLK